MDRGAWRATAHGVTKSRTQLSTHIAQLHLYIKNKKMDRPQKERGKVFGEKEAARSQPREDNQACPGGAAGGKPAEEGACRALRQVMVTLCADQGGDCLEGTSLPTIAPGTGSL